ncbi:MAG: type II toxin-antitoxin system RelE/ParE family toxin [Calditrichia bacterium]
MKVSFHPDARREFFEAIDYYEECQGGLGLEFAEEISSAINRIIYFPGAWAKMSKNTRRCLVNRFPYGVIYQLDKEEINIIAIMQLNKKPGYWKRRIR